MDGSELRRQAEHYRSTCIPEAHRNADFERRMALLTSLGRQEHLKLAAESDGHALAFAQRAADLDRRADEEDARGVAS
jgi:hypothetical protein